MYKVVPAEWKIYIEIAASLDLKTSSGYSLRRTVINLNYNY